MGPIVWLVVAVVFALVELLTLDFSLIMLALSALVVAGVAVVGGGARGVTGVGAGERIRRASAVVGTAGTCGA